MFTVEIVTHCFSGPGEQYARLLAYQLQSLVDHPPRQVRVHVVVAFAADDRPTLGIVSCFREWLSLGATGLSRDQALARPIYRNFRARCTAADVIWFADCDYAFGPGCLDALQQIAGRPEPLFFPRETLIHRDHATGDRYIAAAAGQVIPPIDPADFIPKREHRAIGGIQIVHGDVARREGYCPGERWQRPAPAGTDTIIGFNADAAFRRQLGTPGTPIDVPNLYRLRHTRTGDDRAARRGLVTPPAASA